MTSTARFESAGSGSAVLSSPLHFQFANRDAPNRFLKAAMTERLSSWDAVDIKKRGVPGKAIQTLYQTWGQGNIGLIITGNIMLESDQVATAGDPVIPREDPFHGERFEAFKELARLGKSGGSLMIGQLNHPGRQVDHRIQAHPISASELESKRTPLGFETAAARAATPEDIAKVVDGFAHAAEYLDKAGFDGVELLGAHGYLISQFLSSDTNVRSDKYGGDVLNRARLLTEIAQAIRKRTNPSFILGVKLNSVEFQSSGLQREEAEALCHQLEESQFDFVELSGGTLEHFVHKRESTKRREGFFMEFAESITPLLQKTRVYVTGGFKTLGAMEKAVEKVDGVGLARTLAQEPGLVRHMTTGQVDAAIRQRHDESNYGLTNMVAGSQIRRIAGGQKPLDMSQPENENLFLTAMDKWMEETTTHAADPVLGYPELVSTL